MASILADPNKLAEAIADAARIAERKGVPCTMARVAASTGVALATLIDIANGKNVNDDAHPDSIDIIKKASLAAQADIIDSGFSIRNWAFCIYAAKSMHNLQDRADDSGGNNVTVILNADKIMD